MVAIVAHPTNGSFHREDLRPVFPNADVVEPDAVTDVADELAKTDGPTALLTNNSSFRHSYLDAMNEGDWVATTATGYDSYDFDQFENRDISLTHMPTIYGPLVSQHAIAMALAISRRLYTYYDQQREGRWELMRDELTDFEGDVACVVGLGTIGEAIARRLQAFEMDVRGVKRTVQGYDGAADEVYTQDGLLEAFDGARLVILVVPLTDETRGMIAEKELAACRDNAILINAARGPVVDTGALTRALDSGEIRAAGLDVFDEEPLPENSPLWDRDDVFLTPHSAGEGDKLTQRALDVFEEQFTAWRDDDMVPHRLL